MALGSTQSLTEMSTRCISWGKGGRWLRLTTLPPSCAVVMKSGNLKFLEPCRPLQACNGTALPFFTHSTCGAKAAGAYGWQSLPPSLPIFYKFWEHQPPSTLTACPGGIRIALTLLKFGFLWAPEPFLTFQKREKSCTYCDSTPWPSIL